MGDWSADELARAIERRRGRPRRSKGIVRDGPPPSPTSWSQLDWANRFSFETGIQGRVRGVTQVRIRDTDGEVMWEGGVRELEFEAEPKLGYAWIVTSGDKAQFKVAFPSETIRTAEDAVRAQL